MRSDRSRAHTWTRAQLADERKRREQAERMALLGRMATGLAHEIHNPLSAIRMHAQLFESSPAQELEETAKESLPIILAETVKIESLVSQWMFLARPEPPRVAPLNVAHLLNKVIRTCEPAARHASVHIECMADEELIVNGDARRLQQAASNVILNAIQAMPDGGALQIDASREAGRARLRFADTGAGFSAAALARYSELVKPLDLAEVQETVRQALASFPVEAPTRAPAAMLVGAAPALQRSFGEIAHACASEAPVLISGPTGTGKTHAARIIHQQGARRDGPFITLHCSALPRLCSRLNCSDTNAARLPARQHRRSAISSARKEERFSWTKSRTSRHRFKRSFCDSWKNACSIVSADAKSGKWIAV